jgi:hypothetical protein
MPSVEENRCVAGEAVAKTSTVAVGRAVGLIDSVVEVGTAVGGTLVGGGVSVDCLTGTGPGVQAVRRNRKTMLSFFIESNYMSLQAQGQPICR